jgi:hypothetical protein
MVIMVFRCAIQKALCLTPPLRSPARNGGFRRGQGPEREPDRGAPWVSRRAPLRGRTVVLTPPGVFGPRSSLRNRQRGGGVVMVVWW